MARPLVVDAGLACDPQPTGVQMIAGEVLRRLPAEGEETAWHLLLPPAGEPAGGLPAGFPLSRRPEMNTAFRESWVAWQCRRLRARALLTFSHRAPRWIGCPVIATVYDTVFDEFPECYPAGVAEQLRREVAATCRRAAAVLTLTEDTRSRLIADYRIAARRVTVISCAAGESFRPAGEGDAPPLPEGVPERFFLCIGRPDRRKNFARVAEGVRWLREERGEDVSLVLVGPPGGGSGVEAGRGVVITGYVGVGELVGLYQRTLALVYPSLAEGFGLPILEAMQCGAPVITSNRSSMPEVAGEAALLIDPLDSAALRAALLRVATEPDLRRDLSRRGLARAAGFSWEAVAERARAVALRVAGS